MKSSRRSSAPISTAAENDPAAPGTAPRRARCARCQRPLTHCLCAHIPSLPNRTRVLILQHPDEARHAMNTARLAALGLQNAELLVGETFPQLDGIVAAAEQAVLLFPATACSCGMPAPGTGVDLLVCPTPRGARRAASSGPTRCSKPCRASRLRRVPLLLTEFARRPIRAPCQRSKPLPAPCNSLSRRARSMSCLRRFTYWWNNRLRR